jgi:2-oxoglutarate ferredoxin oxidoreductase subunit beta
MTGGQMAPTTMHGQITTTTTHGRALDDGHPMKVCELLKGIDAVTYLERTAVNSPEGVIKTKSAMKKAIKYQMDGKGFSLVEILAMCPTGWKQTPIQAMETINKEIMTVFKTGVYKDVL